MVRALRTRSQPLFACFARPPLFSFDVYFADCTGQVGRQSSLDLPNHSPTHPPTHPPTPTHPAHPHTHTDTAKHRFLVPKGGAKYVVRFIASTFSKTILSAEFGTINSSTANSAQAAHFDVCGLFLHIFRIGLTAGGSIFSAANRTSRRGTVSNGEQNRKPGFNRVQRERNARNPLLCILLIRFPLSLN